MAGKSNKTKGKGKTGGPSKLAPADLAAGTLGLSAGKAEIMYTETKPSQNPDVSPKMESAGQVVENTGEESSVAKNVEDGDIKDGDNGGLEGEVELRLYPITVKGPSGEQMELQVNLGDSVMDLRQLLRDAPETCLYNSYDLILNTADGMRYHLAEYLEIGEVADVAAGGCTLEMVNDNHAEEQEMEIDALQAILMDDIKELNSSESGLNTTARCFQITISPKDDDEEEPTDIPVRLALVFAHTPKYPDEPPLFDVKSLQGLRPADVQELREKLEKEATENLGMAMIYTLHTSAKEWLREKYGQEQGDLNDEEEEVEKEDIIEPHGEAVTVETFLAWRERFEAELALEKAKLMSESALLASKEKRSSGRTWFESGRASAQKGGKVVDGDSEEELDEEDIDFNDDFDDEDLDEDDMLDHYLSGKSEKTPVRT